MSEHSGYPGAPPGWYQDPAGGPGQRWWDGYAWTESTVLPQQPPPPPWAAAVAPHGPPAQMPPWAVASDRLTTDSATQRVDDERRMVPLARFAVAIPAVYLLVVLLLQRANAAQLRSAGHQFRIDFNDAQHNITPPPYHPPSNSYAPVGLLVGLAHGGRHRHRLHLAAQGRQRPGARSASRPTTRPPGASGRWFVPVVNLWMPYAAVRDCLPPGTRSGRVSCTGGSPGCWPAS